MERAGSCSGRGGERTQMANRQEWERGRVGAMERPCRGAPTANSSGRVGATERWERGSVRAKEQRRGAGLRVETAGAAARGAGPAMIE